MVPATPTRRFRPRFRLRTFLVLVTLFCIWLGWHIHGTRRQREAVEAIRKARGTVTYNYQMQDDRYRFDRRSWAPRILREWLGIDFFHAVAEADLQWNSSSATHARLASDLPMLVRFQSARSVDDADLAHLSRLTRLRHLSLTSADNVTDDGIVALGECDQLRHVSIVGARLSDTSLVVFSRMRDLETLQLPSPTHQFTNLGVSQLRELKKLRVLDLSRAPDPLSGITDEGLSFLMELDDFEVLHVENLGITLEFEEQAKTKFPQCKVYR